MKRYALLILLLVAALGRPGILLAQEKPAKKYVPIKVQVVFTEGEGEKKISSLPYVLNQVVEEDRTPPANLRMGIRVPIYKGGSDSQIQYMDIGTDIDCHAFLLPDGRFHVTLNLDRSSYYAAGPEAREHAGVPVSEASTPVFRSFRGQAKALLRDGQSQDMVWATDPVSGNALKVQVTITVLK